MCAPMPATSFRISMFIKKQPGNQLVYFKQDGERFTSSHTLKLNMNTQYSIEVSIRPPRDLSGVVINGERHEAILMQGDHNFRLHRIDWASLGLDLDKKGKRIEVPLVLEISEFGAFRANIQCKLYKPQELVHSRWGQQLNSIEYECKIGDGGTFIDILKEKYL